jgi:hypothetical protein
MTTPAGLPPWARAANHEQYGGDLNKQNYQSQGVTNPLTDIGAEHITRMAEDMAACARTAAFCVLTIRCNDSTPAAPTIVAANMMTGVRTVSYEGDNPPSGFPSATRLGNGAVRLTFESSYSDDYGVSAGLEIRHVIVGTVGEDPLAESYLISGSSVEVRTYVSNTGVAAVDPMFTIEVSP